MKRILFNLTIATGVIWVIILVTPNFSIQLKLLSSSIVIVALLMAYLGILKRNDNNILLWKRIMLGAGPFASVLYISHKIMNINLIETFVFKHVIRNHRVLIPVMIVCLVLSQFSVLLSMQYVGAIAIAVFLLSFFTWLIVVYEHRLCSSGRQESMGFPTGGYFPLSAIGAFKYYKNVVLSHNKNFYRFSETEKKNKNNHLSIIQVIFQTELIFVVGLFIPFLYFVEYFEIAKNVKVPGFMFWIVLVIIKLSFFKDKKLAKWVLVIVLNLIWVFLVDTNVGRF